MGSRHHPFVERVVLFIGFVTIVLAQKKRLPKPPEPVINPWIALCEGVGAEDCSDYSVSGLFAREKFINHATFGIGKVTEVIGRTKVRVTFEAGKNSLAKPCSLCPLIGYR